MKKNSQPLIEAMESRVHFDVSMLTVLVGANTLPASVSDHLPLKGSVTVTLSNNGIADVVKAKAGVGIFISNGPLDVPSGVYGTLGSKLTTLSLSIGQSKTFVIPIHLAKGKLADGVDTLTAVIAEPEGGFSQSNSFGTLSVHAPIVTLSETEDFLKLADTTAQGAKFHVVDKVAITNSGTDPSTDPITIGAYVTPDGIPADGALMTAVTRRVNTPAGKTVTVPVTIGAIPALGVGSYKLVTQVTQTGGTITTTDPSTAPVVTVTAPITGPLFSDSILSDTPTYTPETLDGALEYLSTVEFKMSIKNTGTAAGGSDTFTLFASPNSTFDTTATPIGQVSLDLGTIPKNGLRTFFVSFNTSQDLDDFSGNEIDDYIFVQVTDATGDNTYASLSTPLKVAGPIVA